MPISDYHEAWNEQEEQWKKLKEWNKKVSPRAKLPKRTHLMDFPAGWSAAIRAATKNIAKLSS